VSDVRRAIVLVGGEGTRLRPLTYTRPKPLLPVVGISIVERKLLHLSEHGIDEVVLSLGYQPDKFLAAFPEGEIAGVRIRYAVEPTPLDTAGAIRFAAAEAGYLGTGETIVVLNGDVITSLDLTSQIAFHRAARAAATIALTKVEDPSAFGVVPTDAEGRVTAFVEKPPKGEAPTDWINAGAYVLEPSVLERIPPDRRVSIEREIFPSVAAEGRLYAVHSPAYWIDTGTPALFVRAALDVLGEGSHLGPGSHVHPTATVHRSVIGAGSRVGPAAVVERSVLLPGAVVEAGACVLDSVLGEGAVVGPGAMLSALTVVGDDAEVPAGAVLVGERLARSS
jgi:NDP-sugar pyrophosphorylase family protein